MKIKKLAIMLVFSLHPIASQAITLCQPDQAKPVFNLMIERSKKMKDVAATKFVHQQAIYDATQEEAVLHKCVEVAKRFNLSVEKFQIFVQLQMDFSKQIQSYWIKFWKTHPKEAPKREEIQPIEQLRAQIGEIDLQLYSTISQFMKATHCQASELRPSFQLMLSKSNETAQLHLLADMLLSTLILQKERE